MDIIERLREYATLPLIGRGLRGRLIRTAMRDAVDEINNARAALRKAARWIDPSSNPLPETAIEMRNYLRRAAGDDAAADGDH